MLASLQRAAAAAAASASCGAWPGATAAAAVAALRVASSSSPSSFASTTSSSSSLAACRGLHTYGAPLSPEQQQLQGMAWPGTPAEVPGSSGRNGNSSGSKAGLPSPWGSSSGSSNGGSSSGEGGVGLPGGFSEDPAVCGHPKDKISLYRRALRRAIYYRKPKDQLAYCSFCKAVGGPHQQLQGTAACNGRCLVGAPQGKYPREYKQPC